MGREAKNANSAENKFILKGFVFPVKWKIKEKNISLIANGNRSRNSTNLSRNRNNWTIRTKGKSI